MSYNVIFLILLKLLWGNYVLAELNEWYPPVSGLEDANTSTCGLECMMTGYKDINVLRACLDQSQIESTKVVWREDGGEIYDEARRTVDGYLTQYPEVVIYSSNKEDVSDAVRCATEGGYPASASGGRHFTLGVIDGYVTIDTSNITQPATINKIDNTLTIPSGFTNGMVLHALHTLAPKNAALSVGNGGSVGYAGYTLAGGLGYATPMVGMACDTLVEIEIVLFDGNVVRSNKELNPELLWATCGGGGGLGILTELIFKYKLIGPNFSYGTVTVSRRPSLSSQAEMTSRLLDYFASPSNEVWGGEVHFHRDTFLLFGLFSKSSAEVVGLFKELDFDKYGVDYALHDTSSFSRASTFFVCDLMSRIADQVVLESEILVDIARISGLNTSTLTNQVKEGNMHCTDANVQDALLTLAEQRSSFVNWGIHPSWDPATNSTNLSVPRRFGKYRFTPNLAPKDMEKLIEVLPTTARRRVIRLTSGLVMSGFDKDGAAFPWRDSPILIRVDDAPIMEVLEEASPNKIGGYYGLPDHANRNWQRLFYGSNYQRLAQTRAKYDPINTFGKLLTPGQLFEDTKAEDTKAPSPMNDSSNVAVVSGFVLLANMASILLV